MTAPIAHGISHVDDSRLSAIDTKSIRQSQKSAGPDAAVILVVATKQPAASPRTQPRPAVARHHQPAFRSDGGRYGTRSSSKMWLSSVAGRSADQP